MLLLWLSCLVFQAPSLLNGKCGGNGPILFKFPFCYLIYLGKFKEKKKKKGNSSADMTPNRSVDFIRREKQNKWLFCFTKDRTRNKVQYINLD